MSTPEPKLDPEAPPKILIVTKASAAESQLETAIALWFNYGDCVSILNLAKAANECYVALGGHKGHDSLFQKWFKLQSKGFQQRIGYLWNFTKHGRGFTKKAELPPRLGEILIIDSIDCHQHLFGTQTPLMSFFMTRFGLEHPRFAKHEGMALLRKQLQVYDLTDGNRTDFLNKAMERLIRLVAMKELKDRSGN